ncbi:MAG: DUF59 domain-containing protein [Verrucomicrobia bacterium]|nr:DUF59 domain-containing protein [Verrucomicrobiota bacterium]
MIPEALDRDNAVAVVREALRMVKYPGYSRDIDSFGMLKEVRLHDAVIHVYLEIGSAIPETAYQIQAETGRILRGLPQLEGREIRVEFGESIERTPPVSGRPLPPLSPMQGETLKGGGFFDPDPMVAATARPDLAPGAGYDEYGPEALGGPMGDRSSTKWQGTVPVFQWEIDPSAPERHEYGEAEKERNGWLFRTWWQVHPAGLVYASISAIPDEDTEERTFARPHPIGRNVAVNLVYDLRRQGVVAVYGTAQDFRPFVEVFLEGFGIGKPNQPGETSTAQEKTS